MRASRYFEERIPASDGRPLEFVSRNYCIGKGIDGAVHIGSQQVVGGPEGGEEFCRPDWCDGSCHQSKTAVEVDLHSDGARRVSAFRGQQAASAKIAEIASQQVAHSFDSLMS